MKYTSENVRREAEAYRKWAKERDKEQYMKRLDFIRKNHGYLKRGHNEQV